MAEYRIESDLLGELKVPAEAYYGVQTQRALENYRISCNHMSDYPDYVVAIAYVKMAAAAANCELGVLDKGIAEAIRNVVEPAQKPVIAGEEGICKGCGVATLSISYYDLGYATGEMAYEVLVNGADVATLPVAFAPNVTKEYNAELCELLGVTVPGDYVAIG